jgi:hypothetical protein
MSTMKRARSSRCFNDFPLCARRGNAASFGHDLSNRTFDRKRGELRFSSGMVQVGQLALFIFLAFFALGPVLAQGGSYYANSCNQTDVNDCINGSGVNSCHAGSASGTRATHTAINGDTINIPAGSCSWSSGISVPSNIGITIIGAGTPNSGASTTGAAASCAGSGATNLTFSGNFTAFTMAPEYGNSTSRISCMQWTYSSGEMIGFSILGTCTSSGCPNLRQDNITFTSWSGHTEAGISYGIEAIGDMFGVVDHNTMNGVEGTNDSLMEQSNASYLDTCSGSPNYVGCYGDNTWAQPESFGSANFLFVENNIFTYAAVGDNEGSAGSQSYQGGDRIVVRYNTFALDSANSVALSWHGTESGGRPRSGRAWEFYGNTLTCATDEQCLEIIGMRGGTGLTWNNAITGSSAGINNYVSLNTYRTQGSISMWGPCDGSSPWDTNDGTTYWSGTVGSVSSNTISVSGTSPGWTTNEWSPNGAPYSVHDVTQNSGSEITGNGSNTLTYASSGGPGQYSATAGDSIQILRATVCLDQAGGRGQGYTYSGISPQSVAANQVLSPTYTWMMSGLNPAFGVTGSDTARVIQNRDYYQETAGQAAQTSATSPFDGTTTIGMGHGTLARRPTTCTTGVGYWATDQGNWDSVGGGVQGELFVCSATNTWTLDYTPYCYPHPLESGSSTSSSSGGSGSSSSGPTPPSCLTATVGG